MANYIGVDGVAQRLSSIYIGDSNGKASKVKRIYIGNSDNRASVLACIEHDYESTYSYSSSHEYCDGTATCKICKDQITETATGSYRLHNSPTCTEEGDYDYTYTWRNPLFAERTSCPDYHTIEALGHDMSDWLVITEPTCTEEGLERKRCVRPNCNYDEERSISPLGHEEVVDEAVEPTCTDIGWTEGKHCSRCGYALSLREAVPALGHSWGSWTTAKKPTCGAEGTKTRTCSRCGQSEDETIPATGLHTYLDTGISNADGEHVWQCKTCGATTTSSVQPIV